LEVERLDDIWNGWEELRRVLAPSASG